MRRRNLIDLEEDIFNKWLGRLLEYALRSETDMPGRLKNTEREKLISFNIRNLVKFLVSKPSNILVLF